MAAKRPGANSKSVSPARAGVVRIGISGWRYPPWRGTFYPQGLPQAQELAWASRQLSTIEINGSFYSLQSPASYRHWHDDTPDGFVFSVKAPRYITHIRRLADVRVPLANFLASGLVELRGKLGPILWQLPPNFTFEDSNRERLEAFLALLPADPEAATRLARAHDAKVTSARVTFGATQRLQHALEVRHESFVDAAFIALLRRHRVALVVADTGGRWPEYEDVTAGFVYLRLHGADALYESGYADAALQRYAARIRDWARGGEPADARRIAPRAAPPRARRDVYCYFDNTAKIEAPGNAARLARLSAAARIVRSGGHAGC